MLKKLISGAAALLLSAGLAWAVLSTDRIVPTGAAPALTSCGTTPAIKGTDIAGTVTAGTTATGCVITFNVPYPFAPHCAVTWRATPLASQSYAVSATAITLTQTSASNNVIDYHCFAATS